MSTRKRNLPDWLTGLSHKSKPNENKHDGNKHIRLAETSARFDKLMDQNMSELIFRGSIIYSFNKSDCSCICEDILRNLEDDRDYIVGFDMEWPVTYQTGSQPKTALIQLCMNESLVYLFHISCFGVLPSQLKQLILSNRIKKVGIGIENDLWKLEKDYDISVMEIIKNSMIDLSKLANEKMKSKEVWSLGGLVKNLLKARIDKNEVVRKSDWSHYPLSETQKVYAATDAYVSYVLGMKLQAM